MCGGGREREEQRERKRERERRVLRMLLVTLETTPFKKKKRKKVKNAFYLLHTTFEQHSVWAVSKDSGVAVPSSVFPALKASHSVDPVRRSEVPCAVATSAAKANFVNKDGILFKI